LDRQQSEQKYLCPNCFGFIAIGDKLCGGCGIQLHWTSGEAPAVDIRFPTHQELLLLLIRPSLTKIFESPPDNSTIDADVILTVSGFHNVKGVNKHILERLSIPCVSEKESVGYAFPTRLDLMQSLDNLVSKVSPPVDHPLELFVNRDVMIIAEGFYSTQLFHHPPQEVMNILGHGAIKTGDFRTSRIVYSCTTVNERAMSDLRTLEITAQRLLDSMSPRASVLPKLPDEIARGWYHDFLDPIFKRAKEIGNK
jgi:hypothetical protein